MSQPKVKEIKEKDDDFSRSPHKFVRLFFVFPELKNGPELEIFQRFSNNRKPALGDLFFYRLRSLG